jgi:hypothetical protein
MLCVSDMRFCTSCAPTTPKFGRARDVRSACPRATGNRQHAPHRTTCCNGATRADALATCGKSHLRKFPRAGYPTCGISHLWEIVCAAIGGLPMLRLPPLGAHARTHIRTLVRAHDCTHARTRARARARTHAHASLAFSRVPCAVRRGLRACGFRPQGDRRAHAHEAVSPRVDEPHVVVRLPQAGPGADVGADAARRPSAPLHARLLWTGACGRPAACGRAATAALPCARARASRGAALVAACCAPLQQRGGAEALAPHRTLAQLVALCRAAAAAARRRTGHCLWAPTAPGRSTRTRRRALRPSARSRGRRCRRAWAGRRRRGTCE